MKKDNLSKKMTYKEAIDRYDVEFIYKGKIRLLFMLPSTEKDYAEALLEDTTIRKIMKLTSLVHHLYAIRLKLSGAFAFGRPIQMEVIEIMRT